MPAGRDPGAQDHFREDARTRAGYRSSNDPTGMGELRIDRWAAAPFNSCMMTIATLTLNPTIDVAYEVDHVFHTRKMRTRSEFYEPGGGGINVARVFVRLGGHARSYYLSGGATGHALDGLLDLHQLMRMRLPIKGHTRVATAVLESESGKEYRFVPPGPFIEPEEWQQCLDQLEGAECDFMVASGSLPPGAPDDFYGRLVALMTRRNIPVVLDSSGRGLRIS